MTLRIKSIASILSSRLSIFCLRMAFSAILQTWLASGIRLFNITLTFIMLNGNMKSSDLIFSVIKTLISFSSSSFVRFIDVLPRA